MRVLRMVIASAIWALALALVVFAQTSAPLQTLSPGEVRVSSHPYVLGETFGWRAV